MYVYLFKPGVSKRMNLNNAPEGQEAAAENEVQEEEITQQSTPESQSSMKDLLENGGGGFDFPRQGEIRKGTVARVTENEILVSIGTKSEGVILSREVDQIEPELREELTIGKEITVYVVNPEDQNGNVLLSYVRALEEKDWLFAESLLASGESYDGKIIGFNKGGLIIPVGQLRGFVPASQVSLLRRLDSSGNTPEQRWGPMVDEPITVAVIEVDRERRRLILSERAALQETRESLKERLLDELSEGDIRTGRVTSLADFGAFVNIDGADGLVHLSEISWERIEHPREVLRVGQEVQVKVIGIDRERKRIGLSIRQLQEDPWVKKIDNLKEGQLIEGTITHLTKFGAFARLDEDLEGLIHISEISEQRVTHPKEVLHEGDVVTLRVIKIEPERHRIGLSLRKVDSPAYTDFDWKMTLAEVVEGTQGEEEVAAEAEVSGDETQALEEGDEPRVEAEASIEEAPVEEETPVEVEASIEEEPEEEEPPDEAEASVEEVLVEEEPPVEAEASIEEAPVEEEPPDEAEASIEEEPVEEEPPDEVEASVEEESEEEEPPVEAEASIEEEPEEEEPSDEVEDSVEEAPVEEESPVEEEASTEEAPEEEEPPVEAETSMEELMEEEESILDEAESSVEETPVEVDADAAEDEVQAAEENALETAEEDLPEIEEIEEASEEVEVPSAEEEVEKKTEESESTDSED
jgi:small subunit ribosomal protein S1